MRAACRRTGTKRAIAGVTLLLLLAVLITAPWWWTWLLWRPSSTSYVDVGPGYSNTTYLVTEAAARRPPLIPAIIHQTWKTESVPEKWRAAQQSCRDMNPSYEYVLWTDATSRQLIAEKYPALLPTFDAYPYAIERADVVRYALLHAHGGFYLDLDIVCKAPLDFMRPYPFVMPATKPVGFSNDFLASVPGHAVLAQMLEALPRWRMPLLTKYPTVMFSTGPMFVTLQVSVYLDRAALWVLPDTVYGKYVHGRYPIFEHLHGSSWHGDDAKSILFFVRHPIFLVLMGAMVSCGVLLWAVLFCRLKILGWRLGGSGGGRSLSPLIEVMTLKSS